MRSESDSRVQSVLAVFDRLVASVARYDGDGDGGAAMVDTFACAVMGIGPERFAGCSPTWPVHAVRAVLGAWLTNAPEADLAESAKQAQHELVWLAGYEAELAPSRVKRPLLELVAAVRADGSAPCAPGRTEVSALPDGAA